MKLVSKILDFFGNIGDSGKSMHYNASAATAYIPDPHIIVANLTKRAEFMESKRHLDKLRRQSDDVSRELQNLMWALDNYIRGVSKRTIKGTRPMDLDSFITCMWEPLLVADPSGVIVKTNKAASSLFKYSEMELLGKYLTDLLPKDTVERKAKFFKSAINSSNTDLSEIPTELVRIKAKDKSNIKTDVTFTSVNINHAIFTIVTLRDPKINETIRVETKSIEDLARDYEKNSSVMFLHQDIILYSSFNLVHKLKKIVPYNDSFLSFSFIFTDKFAHEVGMQFEKQNLGKVIDLRLHGNQVKVRLDEFIKQDKCIRTIEFISFN